MELIFERSRPGRGTDLLPPLDVPECPVPEEFARKKAPRLPEIGESDLSRHYQALARRAFGVCDGFYPLGSCTMKYNPKIGEDMAALPGFTGVHPLQPAHTIKGCQLVMAQTEYALAHITGMDRVTLQPRSGPSCWERMCLCSSQMLFTGLLAGTYGLTLCRGCRVLRLIIRIPPGANLSICWPETGRVCWHREFFRYFFNRRSTARQFTGTVPPSGA